MSVLILIVFTKINIVFSNFNIKCVKKKLKTSLFEKKKKKLDYLKAEIETKSKNH